MDKMSLMPDKCAASSSTNCIAFQDLTIDVISTALESFPRALRADAPPALQSSTLRDEGNFERKRVDITHLCLCPNLVTMG